MTTKTKTADLSRYEKFLGAFVKRWLGYLESGWVGGPPVSFHRDPLEAWQHELAGPLTLQYFKIHSRDQLYHLAAELDVFMPAGKTKAVAINILMASPGTKKKLPAEIASRIGTKRRSKPR